MNLSKEAEQLGVSQIMLLHSFIQIKSEILALLVDERDEAVMKPLKRKTSQMDEVLELLNQAYIPPPKELEAEALLRRRGCGVLLKKAGSLLAQIRLQLVEIHDWSKGQFFDGWEDEILQKTMHSLYHILEATAHVIGNPMIFAQAQNPFENQ